MKTYLVVDQTTGAITNVISTFFMPKENESVFFIEKDNDLEINFLQYDYAFIDGNVIAKERT